jgi:glycosyltransferase involved in cell wall biosynthesis
MSDKALNRARRGRKLMENTTGDEFTILAGLPMYNEEETIGTIVLQVSEHVDKVICVDDGSSDSCASIATRLGAEVIRHRFNRGYGGALKSIFHRAIELDVDVLVVLDADGQHAPEDISRLVQPIRDGDADVVIGSRFVEGGDGVSMPAYRKLGIKVITAASNLSSDLGINDTQSGFRAFSRLALQRLRFDSEGMELSLELLEDAKEKNLSVKEVPTIIRYDVPKGSSYTPVSHGFVVFIYALITLSQKKPLLVLGLPGVSLLLAGAAMGMQAVNQVSEYTQFTVGAGLSAIWVGVLGLALIATGVVLQSARTFMRLLIVREFGMD